MNNSKDQLSDPRSQTGNWYRFWFEKIDATSICFFRIAFGLTVLASLITQYLPNYLLFFGPNSVIPSSHACNLRFGENLTFDLLALIPQTEQAALVFLYISCIIAVFFTIGFCTRIFSILLFFSLLSLNNHFPYVVHGGDNFARLIALFMMFARSNAYFSVDALINKTNNKVPSSDFEPYAQRLIQVQLCFIYLANVFHKILGTDWNFGSAVYYATRLDQYFRFPLPLFLDTEFGTTVCTWTTLYLELLIPVLIWIKPFRPYVICIAIAFHLVLDYIFNLGMFEWYFIICFILFLDKEDISKLNLVKKLPRHNNA